MQKVLCLALIITSRALHYPKHRPRGQRRAATDAATDADALIAEAQKLRAEALALETEVAGAEPRGTTSALLENAV